MVRTPPNHVAELNAAAPLCTDSLTARIASDLPGVIEAPAGSNPAIVIHIGQSVDIGCRRGAQTHRGRAVHGDIDIIPAGMPSRWEVKQKDTALLIAVHASILCRVAGERGLDFQRVEVVNRFQMRDPQIEHIGWALKAEMEAGYPAGTLFTDSLATALAARLLDRHSTARQGREERLTMPGHKLRLVLSYVEDNLAGDLRLPELAAVAGLGMSQFKRVFRDSVGVPVHQYVIQRRLERAKSLLSDKSLPVGQIAIEAGFAHQSHLARHLRRATGVPPTRFRQHV
jgi:AraC family transcriptional regulator